MHFTFRLKASLFCIWLGLPLITAAQTVHPAQSTLKVPDTLEQRLKACTACHGAEGRAGSDGFYPRIAGKPAGYLYNQLLNFREGKRAYPAMRYMVAHMSDAYLQEIADYFASQHPPYAAPQATEANPVLLEQGRQLVMLGDKARNLPACVSCHGKSMTGLAPFMPGLVGLPRDYLIAQLGAWQTGSRKAHAPDCMQQVARKLKPEDIAAVSSWLAAQTVSGDSLAPVLKSTEYGQLPVKCGSLSQSFPQKP
ncbi:c-type cytochrome [Undibacterium sp. Ji42W]|uniref:c-type cytochrome n=1 Tax=Undibacterium sp. Ji42W TaxID=3413039 RepID=UPI003BEFBA3B